MSGSRMTGRRLMAGILLAALAAPARGAAPAGTPAVRSAEAEVSPAEDLMREHGVLRRIMFVYEEALRRLEDGQDVPPAPLAEAAGIVRSFIEDYHEKLEEDFLFPRLRKAAKQLDLTDILVRQHRAGRRFTDIALRLCDAQAFKNPDDRRTCAEALRRFIAMYGPHAAREDTVLFPEFRKLVSASEYAGLGDRFEQRERESFGAEGFEKTVARVAAIEARFGINDLRRFTPRD